MSLKVITPPTLEPVTLSEMKVALKIDISDEDGFIESLISAARRNLERTYRRALITQELVVGLDFFGQAEFMPTWVYGWPPSVLSWGPSGWIVPVSQAIELPTPPIQSIVSVTYLDPLGATQTLAPANYLLDSSSEPGRLLPALNKMWPVTAPLPQAVSVDYLAGYTSPALVPDDIKAALRLLVGHWYHHREQVMVDKRIVAVEIPIGVEALMAPYKTWLLR